MAPNQSSSNNDNNNNPAAKGKPLKLKVVVIRKKLITKKPGNRNTGRNGPLAPPLRRPGNNQPSRGLPSFPIKTKALDRIKYNTNNDEDDNGSVDPFQQDGDDQFFANLDCDTLLAIRSLQQQRHNPNQMPACLEIPVVDTDGGSTIQGS